MSEALSDPSLEPPDEPPEGPKPPPELAMREILIPQRAAPPFPNWAVATLLTSFALSLVVVIVLGMLMSQTARLVREVRTLRGDLGALQQQVAANAEALTRFEARLKATEGSVGVLSEDSLINAFLETPEEEPPPPEEAPEDRLAREALMRRGVEIPIPPVPGGF